MFVLLKFKMSNVKIRSSGVKREWCPDVKDDNSFTSVKLFMNNKYSAVDILCRPGPSTVLTSEDDRGIRRCFWMGGLTLWWPYYMYLLRLGGLGAWSLKSILVNSETNYQ